MRLKIKEVDFKSKKLLKYHMNTIFWKVDPLQVINIRSFIGGK